MKRLFVIDNDNDMDLNKEWLHLIPEFSIILHRVWKCEGDADGRKKLMQRRVFGYIYLTVDYASPLFTWEKDARQMEAMKMMNLKSGDLEHENIMAAIKKYDDMQYECAPTMKALRAMYASVDKMNQFLEDIDLSQVDKQGKPMYTPASITRAIKEMNAAYDAIHTMERRVQEQLKQEGGNTIRGTATLGGREGKRDKNWSEGSGPTTTEVQKSINEAIENGKVVAAVNSPTDYRSMGNYLNDLTKDTEEDND